MGQALQGATRERQEERAVIRYVFLGIVLGVVLAAVTRAAPTVLFGATHSLVDSARAPTYEDVEAIQVRAREAAQRLGAHNRPTPRRPR